MGVSGFGKMVEIKIVDQFNSHDILFKGHARVNYPEELEALFSAARKKGFPDFPREGDLNHEYLFGKRT